MRQVMASCIIAFSTYSCIPMPRVDWTDENRRCTMCFFPMIGAVIGLALWGWLGVCDALALNAVLRGAVGAVISLLVTGGIHMDGFMDTCDALASWQTRERRLEILKDSHTGAFAVMGCAGILLVTAGLLGEAGAEDGLLLATVFVTSRSLSAWTLAVLPSARKNGMLDGFARTAHRRLVIRSSAVYLLLCAAVWFRAGLWMLILCSAGTAALTWGYRRMALQQFGGVTGDLAGWLVQVTELVLTAAIVLGGKIC